MEKKNTEKGVSFVRINVDNKFAGKGPKKNPINMKSGLDVFEFSPGDPGVHSLILKHLKKQHKIKTAACATYLNNNDYQLLTAEAPSVPDEELIDALRWSVKDLLSIPASNATLDTFEVPGQTSTKKSINIVSVKKEIIASLDTLFSNEKLALTIIDIEELALRNLAALDDKQKKGVVVLWLKQNYGKILFIKDNDLYLARNINIGHQSITSFSAGFERIALEVQRSIDYFERHHSQVSMNNLLVMPMEKGIGDFVSFLNSNLSISCHQFELKTFLPGSEKLGDTEIAQHLLTFGTALRQQDGAQ